MGKFGASLSKEKRLSGLTDNKYMDVKEMARLGGLASAKSRLKGKTKKEISKLMREIRLKQYAKS